MTEAFDGASLGIEMNADGHVRSYYAESVKPGPRYRALQGEIETDVCVVGGGFTGLSTALHLSQRGYDVVLLEAKRVGWGASGRNGGQSLVGLSAGMPRTARLLGEAWARRLWDLSVDAVQLQRRLIQAHDIDCDYRPGYFYAAAKPRDMAQIEAEHELLRQWGYRDARLVDADEAARIVVGPRYSGGLLDQRSGHLHPLKYAVGLGRAVQVLGVKIHEGSEVLSIGREPALHARCDNGRVTCRYLVLAGNAYMRGLRTDLDARILPVRSYILATEPLGEERARHIIPNNVCVSDSNRILNYYRFSDDWRLLFGGLSDFSLGRSRDQQVGMRRQMLALFPDLAGVEIDHIWAGDVAITRNRLPQIGRLDGEIYFAQGFSGHGVALTTLFGQLVAEAISGTAERFDAFARIPHRPIPGGRRFGAGLRGIAMLWHSFLDAL